MKRNGVCCGGEVRDARIARYAHQAVERLADDRAWTAGIAMHGGRRRLWRSDTRCKTICGQPACGLLRRRSGWRRRRIGPGAHVGLADETPIFQRIFVSDTMNGRRRARPRQARDRPRARRTAPPSRSIAAGAAGTTASGPPSSTWDGSSSAAGSRGGHGALPTTSPITWRSAERCRSTMSWYAEERQRRQLMDDGAVRR